MQGLPPRWKHFKDEIYTKLRGPGRNMEILSTIEENGRHEPIMWTVRYGKGRVFVDVLGHCGNDPEMIYSILCTGFQVNLAAWCRMGLPPERHPASTQGLPAGGHLHPAAGVQGSIPCLLSPQSDIKTKGGCVEINIVWIPLLPGGGVARSDGVVGDYKTLFPVSYILPTTSPFGYSSSQEEEN